MLNMRHLLFIGVAMSCFGGVVQTAAATPINLVQNGSFEDGLTFYTTTGGGDYPVSVIVTDGVTGSAFGEAIPSDPLITGSPDEGRLHAAYFVDDVAHQTLIQTIFLPVGTYEIGFDAYNPLNGYNNPNDATFTGSIAGVNLANYSVKSSPVATWTSFNGLATITAAGNYLVSFDFAPMGFMASGNAQAADVVIDRVYVIASDRTGGTPIPEPITLSLFGAGLICAGAVRRRKKLA